MGIKLKDGTVIKNMYMGGGMIGYQNNSSDDYVYAYATDRIIDPDQIAYFLFIGAVQGTNQVTFNLSNTN